MDSPNQIAARLGHLLEGIDIAMLTTLGDRGYPVSRPLSTQAASFDGKVLWFFTEADSPKVGEIRRHPKVNLGYASKEKNIYVSIAGDARILRDQRKINQLWSDALKAFFPNGKEDPNLVLLEVGVRTAEYWEGPGSLLGQLLTFVVARATGEEEVMGENRILDLTGPRATSRLPPSSAAAKRAGRKAPRSSGPPAVKSPVRKATKKAAKKATKSTATKSATKKSAAAKKAPAKAARKPAARNPPAKRCARR
jgi:general stress protein 26